MYLLIAAAEIQHLDSEFETKGWFASLVASITVFFAMATDNLTAHAQNSRCFQLNSGSYRKTT
jgi:hypothetical protein